MGNSHGQAPFLWKEWYPDIPLESSQTFGCRMADDKKSRLPRLQGPAALWVRAVQSLCITTQCTVLRKQLSNVSAWRLECSCWILLASMA
jgi:hypothetical protein